MASERGKFITLEGGEGGGKSTQAKRLSDWLSDLGIPVMATKQPGGTEIGAKIREILLHVDHARMAPWCEALLYLADRAQHVREAIEPALASGKWVVCDRYQDSTVVYQSIARKVDARIIEQIFSAATGNLLPDLTLVLQVEPLLGLKRARARNNELGLASAEGRFEEETEAFHQQVSKGFRDLAIQNRGRMFLIDAAASQDQVAEQIRLLVEKKLALHV